MGRQDLIALLRLLSALLALASLARGDLGVGGAVEVNEEVEVGPDDETGEQVSVSLIRAAVLGITVVVDDGRRVGDEDDDELDDLDGSDVLLPPNVLSGSHDHDEVVPVPVTTKRTINVGVRIEESGFWTVRRCAWARMWKSLCAEERCRVSGL